MNTALLWLVEQLQPAFSHPRVYERAKTLIFSSLLCLGRHTITGLLSTCGQQFVDWSAAYRIFERRRFDPTTLFDVPLRATIAALEPMSPIIAALDDSILRKRGRHVYGTAWRRDPLGPHFSTNLVWAQRVLQVSLLLPAQPLHTPGGARAIPVDLSHCPTARKPSRKATEQDWDAYRQLRRTQRISVCGATTLHHLRQRLDQDPDTAQRLLVTCVDGGFTNRELFAHPPSRTALIGRIRKDARLFLPASQTQRKRNGRRRIYGEQLPTPEQMRQDPLIPWTHITAFAAGRCFTVRIKSIGPVLWRPAGGTHPMRLIIIEPLAYRPRAGAHLLYRMPGYLLCSDLTLSEQDIVQWYFWRWELELNFRDEKTLLGVGEAQVRTPMAVEAVPQFQVAGYACLLLAHHQVREQMDLVPAPAWQRGHPERESRCTTMKMISQLRAEVWADAINGEHFSDFGLNQQMRTKSEKFDFPIKDAILYAVN